MASPRYGAPIASEAHDIRSIYERHYSVELHPDWWGDPWSERNLRAVYYRHAQERAIIAALNEARLELAGADILDVGCGNAWVLRFLVNLRADPSRLHGIDLVPERIALARLQSPAAFDLRVGDATALPYDDSAFDVVCQFTALSSFTETDNRERFASEMARVLRPGGHVLWLEITRQLPGARTRAVPSEELRSLFPGFAVLHERPLFHRRTALLARWPALCSAVEHLPLEKTNALAVLRKPPESSRSPEPS